MSSKEEKLQQENQKLRDTLSRLKNTMQKRESCERSSATTDATVRLLVDDEFQGKDKSLTENSDPNRCLTIVVLGASGDLAKKKTFPALYHLYSKELLPKKFLIVGYSRTKMDREKFHKHLTQNFPKDAKGVKEFTDHCYYHAGQYNSEEDFGKLADAIGKWENELCKECKVSDRIFYMAVPPVVFVASAKGIKSKAMSKTGSNRVIVEKPFGEDFESASQLSKDLGALFEENQIYRIDHYLGKEMVQNLMALRFANSVFEPLWNHRFVQCVVISFKENFGTEGRGGYFDKFGIIRDVMQNHLMQVLSLLAMEPPVSLGAEDVRDEKVKVLRAIPPLELEDTVLGQYGQDAKKEKPAYTDDEGVPDDSNCPTFALAVLKIKNPRWDGVPFIIKCGKALNERKAEIRIQFKPAPGLLFPNSGRNELVCRLQPKEAVYLKMTMKKPGLTSEMVSAELDLTYHSRFGGEPEIQKGLPDAYERLIFDVVRGDHNLFVRVDELLAAWKIFTPLLHRIEKEKIKPLIYEYGSRGPAKADAMARSVGYRRDESYSWPGTPKM